MAIGRYFNLMIMMISIAIIVAVSSFINTPYFALASFLIFLIAVKELYRIDKFYVIALSPLLFFWITELFSGIFIEFGALMVETRTVGEPTGAFSRLSFIYAIFLFLGLLAWRAMFPRLINSIRKSEVTSPRLQGAGLFLSFVFIVVLAFFVIGVIKGFPLILGVDRFSYRADFGSKALSSFLDNRIIIFSILGACFALRRYRLYSLLLFVFTVAVSILYGEKFTSIVQAFVFFSIPSALLRLSRARKLPLSTVMMVMAAVTFLTIPAILINYGIMQDGGASAFSKLFNRAALQGQLWYLADKNYAELFKFEYHSISSALKSLFFISLQSPSSAADHGMYYVMRPFTDSSTMYWVQYAQGGFVFAHMPYWLMASGLVGALVVGLVTVIYAVWVCANANIALFSGNVFEAAIWFKVVVWLYAGFTTGNIWFFFGVKSIVLILVALGWRQFVQQKSSDPSKSESGHKVSSR